MILAPRRTLPRVAIEPGFWLPILIVAVAYFGVRMTMLPNMREHYASAEFIEWYAEQRGISQAQAERDVAGLSRKAPLLNVVEAPMVVTAGVLSVAVIIYLIGRLGYRGAVRFRYVFSMVAWATVVSAIPLFITIPLKLINTDWNFETSPAALFPPELIGGYIHRFLQSIDLFLIWQVWLLGIGLSALYRVSIQRALGAIGTIFIIFAVLNALFTTPVQ